MSTGMYVRHPDLLAEAMRRELDLIEADYARAGVPRETVRAALTDAARERASTGGEVR